MHTHTYIHVYTHILTRTHTGSHIHLTHFHTHRQTQTHPLFSVFPIPMEVLVSRVPHLLREGMTEPVKLRVLLLFLSAQF